MPDPLNRSVKRKLVGLVRLELADLLKERDLFRQRRRRQKIALLSQMLARRLVKNRRFIRNIGKLLPAKSRIE